MRFGTAFCLAFILSCTDTSWPTDAQTLIQILNRERASFLAIEDQMREDGFYIMSARLLSPPEDGSTTSMAHLLALIQGDKYRHLIPSNSPYIYKASDDLFSVLLPANMSDAGNISTWLVRSKTRNFGNSCHSANLDAPCGECSIQIDDEWSARWTWPARDSVAGPQGCQDGLSDN